MIDDELLQEFKAMDKEKLQAALAELREDYKEMEEQRSFMLRSTGHHIGGGARKNYDQKLRGLKSLIQAVEKDLQKR